METTVGNRVRDTPIVSEKYYQFHRTLHTRERTPEIKGERLRVGGETNWSNGYNQKGVTSTRCVRT